MSNSTTNLFRRTIPIDWQWNEIVQVSSGLTPNQQRRILQIARAAAERALAGRTEEVVHSEPPLTGCFDGVFVTYHHGSRLRGCVGAIGPIDDLETTVARVAVAALRDPRFAHEPITLEELPQIDIELSILHDLEETRDPLNLVVGLHGIRVEMDGRSGCFLPKVASERGWSAEEFLMNCCAMKAGLPPDAWRNPRCRVSLFKVDGFREPNDSPNRLQGRNTGAP